MTEYFLISSLHWSRRWSRTARYLTSGAAPPLTRYEKLFHGLCEPSRGYRSDQSVGRCMTLFLPPSLSWWDRALPTLRTHQYEHTTIDICSKWADMVQMEHIKWIVGCAMCLDLYMQATHQLAAGTLLNKLCDHPVRY